MTDSSSPALRPRTSRLRRSPTRTGCIVGWRRTTSGATGRSTARRSCGTASYRAGARSPIRRSQWTWLGSQPLPTRRRIAGDGRQAESGHRVDSSRLPERSGARRDPRSGDGADGAAESGSQSHHGKRWRAGDGAVRPTGSGDVEAGRDLSGRLAVAQGGGRRNGAGRVTWRVDGAPRSRMPADSPPPGARWPRSDP